MIRIRLLAATIAILPMLGGAAPAYARGGGIEIIARDNYAISFLQAADGRVRYCQFYLSSRKILCDAFV